MSSDAATPQAAQIAPDKLRQSAVAIASKLSRGVLQQALVDSRIKPRGTDISELKPLARSESAWTNYVLGLLESPEKRGAAMRALGILVNAYIRMPGLDHRVENSFRKAHQASERGDSERVRRELVRLQEVGQELGQAELRCPEHLLYMWAASEQSRELIAELAHAIESQPRIGNRADIQSPNGPGALASSEASPTRTKRPEVTSEVKRPNGLERHLELTSSGGEDSPFVLELKLLAEGTSVAASLDWQLFSAFPPDSLPSREIVWPSLEELELRIAQLKNLSTLLNSLPAGSPLTAIDIPSIRTVVDTLGATMPDFGRFQAEIGASASEVIRVASDHVERLLPMFKSEGEQIVCRISEDSSLWNVSIPQLQELVRRNHDTALEERTELLNIGKSIEALVAHLPANEQTVAEHKVRFLMRRNRVAELNALNTEYGQRFTHKEMLPLAKDLAGYFRSAVETRSQFMLEDLARGVGQGARYGDPITAKAILIGLAEAAELGSERISQLDAALAAAPKAQAPTHSLKDWCPHWLVEGVLAFRIASADSAVLASSITRATFNVQIPRSVQLRGGFVLQEGLEQVEIAIQVGNPKNPNGIKCAAAELLVPAQRNPWLVKDSICYLGPMMPEDRVLAPLRLILKPGLQPAERMEIQTQLRYRETIAQSTRAQDDKFNFPVSTTTTVTIADYAGASGRPMILAGDSLALSSEDVRKALTYIRRSLSSGSVTALIFGRRRRGKTSILQTIANDADARRQYIILFDTVEDLPFRSLGEAMSHLGNILDRLARQMGIDEEPIEPVLGAQPQAAWPLIQEWLEKITSKLRLSTRALLLVDEFQKWISLLDAESRTKTVLVFRGFMNRPEGEKLSLSVILSGLSSIGDYAKNSTDFLVNYRRFEIRAFNSDEASALIRSKQTIEYDTRAIARIFELTGGNPFLVNLLGNEIASRLREYGRPYCFPYDVERVVEERVGRSTKQSGLDVSAISPQERGGRSRLRDR